MGKFFPLFIHSFDFEFISLLGLFNFDFGSLHSISQSFNFFTLGIFETFKVWFEFPCISQLLIVLI